MALTLTVVQLWMRPVSARVVLEAASRMATGQAVLAGKGAGPWNEPATEREVAWSCNMVWHRDVKWKWGKK